MPVLAVRRRILALAAATALLATTATHAVAQSSPPAFVQDLGNRLIGVVNEPGPTSAKSADLQPILDSGVDVDGIGRFCLGHYWLRATPQQQSQYLGLFHSVLMKSILGHLGSYRGVHFTVGQTTQAAEGAQVATTIYRPGEAPADVEWVIGAGPKVVDVVAEGTSLRTTQRDEYTSYLGRHGGDVDVLIRALQRQAARNEQG